jgi:hypothetical protein
MNGPNSQVLERDEPSEGHWRQGHDVVPVNVPVEVYSSVHAGKQCICGATEDVKLCCRKCCRSSYSQVLKRRKAEKRVFGYP